MSDEELDEDLGGSVDEGERREAEALARALERGSADEDLPEAALQTAALLRYSADGGALDVERAESILGEVLDASAKAAAKKAAKKAAAPAEARMPLWRRGWRWVLGLSSVAALAILLLFLLRTGAVDPSAVDETVLPAPSAGLLSAQLARVSAPEADADFDREMGTYRADVYAALTERYGAR
jgi:hypothetical protein